VPTTEETFQLAVQYHQSGYLPQAEQLYLQVVQAEPGHAQARCNLGVLAINQGRFADALAHYQEAIRLQPDFSEAYFNLGNAFSKAGQLDAAANAYRDSVRLKPDLAAGHFNLGRTLAQLGRHSEAVDSFRANLRLLPASAEARTYLANALWASGQQDAALDLLHEAIRQQPDYAEGYYFLACALSSRPDKIDECIANLKKVVELKPEFAEAHNNLGIALESQGKIDEAIYHWHQALYLRPHFYPPYNNLGNAYTLQGSIDQAIENFRKAIELQPGQPHVHSNLVLTFNYHGSLDPEAVLREHQHWSQLYTPRAAPTPPIHDPNPDRRLRIGYVSADFRGHTVAAFVEPILAAHDHDRFHITCYANVLQPDAVTERMKALADEWRPIASISDDQAAAQIRADAIDILIDLSGHTAGNRLLLFARKPAPIQITHFGYPNTTAVPGMDYRISDAYADPPGATEHLYTERVLRLPEIAWCWQPPEGTTVSELPAPKAGRITFASFNNLAKVTDEVVALWARILQAVPQSRLHLLSGMGSQGTRRVNDAFGRHGIGTDRVTWMTRRPKDEYFRLYHDVDIALDPFPYNGGVTTCDALWLGVPVLALAGRSYVSRQGVSILANLGLQELVGETPEACVEIATRLASDLPRLKELRAGLRARMQNSVLTDTKRFTRQLEAAYRWLWQYHVSEATKLGLR